MDSSELVCHFGNAMMGSIMIARTLLLFYLIAGRKKLIGLVWGTIVIEHEVETRLQ